MLGTSEGGGKETGGNGTEEEKMRKAGREGREERHSPREEGE